METILINIEKIPEEQEIKSLLGEDIYRCYREFCDIIISQFLPDREIWDSAGRRGKYFHGYRNNKKTTLIDIYLFSTNGQGKIKCEFNLNKRFFIILKKRELFSTETQREIDTIADYYEKNGVLLSFANFVNDKTLQDFFLLLKIVS
jgi:hypothetical protein